jgi:hypothetical protein
MHKDRPFRFCSLCEKRYALDTYPDVRRCLDCGQLLRVRHISQDYRRRREAMLVRY